MGKLDAAVDDFAKACALAPTRDGPWTRLGILRMRRSEFALAVPAFDKAIELNAKNAAAIGNRGICEYHLGRFSESHRDLKRAIELDPTLGEQLAKWRDLAAKKLKDE